jgi:hypothetical protein
MVLKKSRKIGRIEKAQILNAEETIPANLLHLVMNITIFKYMNQPF